MDQELVNEYVMALRPALRAHFITLMIAFERDDDRLHKLSDADLSKLHVQVWERILG